MKKQRTTNQTSPAKTQTSVCITPVIADSHAALNTDLWTHGFFLRIAKTRIGLVDGQADRSLYSGLRSFDWFWLVVAHFNYLRFKGF